MEIIVAKQDGVSRRTTSTFFRGDSTNFYPNEMSFDRDDIVSEYIAKGWMPAAPYIGKETPIAAFGSCFAANISAYLHERGFNVLTKADNGAYVTRMGEGMVNTFAIRQQFEWAWLGKVPKSSLWHGYSAEEFGYDEDVRLATKALFDRADVFIITLGLSEIWYDEPTGEVFWRAIPIKQYDPARHKFRVSSVAENLDNLRAIYRLIRDQRPDATIIFTVSPIPLQATFRNVSCVAANSVSKSILRVAVDELYRELSPTDGRLFYFPSYEVVMYLFANAWQPDRRHVHARVLQFNMEIFERYYCLSGLDDAAMLRAFRETRKVDVELGGTRRQGARRESFIEKSERQERITRAQARRKQSRADGGDLVEAKARHTARQERVGPGGSRLQDARHKALAERLERQERMRRTQAERNQRVASGGDPAQAEARRAENAEKRQKRMAARAEARDRREARQIAMEQRQATAAAVAPQPAGLVRRGPVSRFLAGGAQGLSRWLRHRSAGPSG